MAQGEQKRMGNSISEPKQLIEVAGEPIIARTYRMLREWDCDSTVVARERDGGFCKFPCMELDNPGPCLITGILECLKVIPKGRELLFLLGDVIYQRSDLKRIVAEETRSVLLWGRDKENPLTKRRRAEMYALRVGVFGLARIGKALEKGCANLHDIRLSITDHNEYREVTGWTDDIDYPEDLKLLPAFGEAIKAEEGGR